MINRIEQLQSRFGSHEKDFLCAFSQRGELIICDLKTPMCVLSFAIQGAHILSWKPRGEEDVFWLSTDADFSPGQSIRGGIPICWPWFGTHDFLPHYPSHGFARSVDWQLIDVEMTDELRVVVHFQLDTRTLSDALKSFWEEATIVDYFLDVGADFKAKLVTRNVSDSDIVIGQALHSYFAVDDVRTVVVTGLDGCEYLDKPQQFKRLTQQGNVRFTGEVDRVYLETLAMVKVVDRNRTLSIKKQGSRSTVVWNPGEKVANKMGDLGQQGYLNMLCIESANVGNDVVMLASGEQTELSVVYQL